MGGHPLRCVPALCHHRRRDLFMQRAPALGRYLLVNRFVQKRMAEPEPLFVFLIQQAG